MAILGTLLLTALGSAQKKSRQIRCVANLHQLSLALGMYLDDFNRRPPSLAACVSGGYLPEPRVLICPQDATRDWAGVLGRTQGMVDWLVVSRDAGFEKGPMAAVEEDPPCSYLIPLGLEEDAWARLLRAGGQAGLAVCQMHGFGGPSSGSVPSIYDFQGVILRAQRDGAVVARKVFWGTESTLMPSFPPETSTTDKSGAGVASLVSPGGLPWRLFVDDLPD
jgi:hypothetical protein